MTTTLFFVILIAYGLAVVALAAYLARWPR